ncbi:probable aspartyl protease At4g16563 [Cajanus cajan]|uniref:Aspartic proteinase nepenthesin-2 n=1 Tax=Cajanus cajan TaxID=3821 RepID=A0A151U3I1_CAJCA|nr:probable aspartyl protease At4g16563 [Cajanus cajan]KYP73831.1 Aspartic proteinase nepenthesin-2 [Cajanus cajan]
MTPLHIFLLLSLLSITTSTPHTITLPLSPLSTNHPSHTLKLAATTSLTRARHLKKTHHHSLLKTPLHPKSYGGYSINLNFGTPPQTFPFLLDTGSTLLWLPCSSHYLCSKCSSFRNTPKPFIPKNSSSSKLLGCSNPRCAWLFGPNVKSHCCKHNAVNCSQTCPPYTIQYGLGSTAGFLLSENLNFPEKIVNDFLLGCSVVSVYQPTGIAGFGRGPESLPSQMNLTRFSYCLLSHKFDDSPSTSSNLVLETTSQGRTKTNGVTYTPFTKNINTNRNPAFGAYYYVTLRRIVVGGKRVRVPKRLLEVDANGDGGLIVDSGSTFTFMERPIYDLVAQEFRRQVNYTRAREVEARSGLGPCFVAPGGGTTSFPEMSFEFRGGAKMRLPVANYFSLVGEESDVACLTVVSDDVAGPGVAAGPALILGNYQQQNFYVEYDLENERFGFRRQSCKTSV